MSSTKKRGHSPEVGRPFSSHHRTSFHIQQHAPPKKRRCRGLKDDRLKAIRNLECRHRAQVFEDIDCTIIAHSTHHVATAPFESPLQSPGRAVPPPVPHSPPSVPAEDEDGGLEIFNDPPASPHDAPASGLYTASGIQDNQAFFWQTRHLDDHIPVWNQRWNKQATQWQSVAIPRLIPIYLANRAATESGKLPPPPMQNHPCQCDKVELNVKMVTWDRKFALHLIELFVNFILHQALRSRYCISVNAIRHVCS